MSDYYSALISNRPCPQPELQSIWCRQARLVLRLPALPFHFSFLPPWLTSKLPLKSQHVSCLCSCVANRFGGTSTLRIQPGPCLALPRLHPLAGLPYCVVLLVDRRSMYVGGRRNNSCDQSKRDVMMLLLYSDRLCPLGAFICHPGDCARKHLKP